MTVYKSQRPSLDIPDVSVTDYALRHLDRLADKTAFIEGMSERSVSYSELASSIRGLAGGLSNRGIGPGTTWALMAPNGPEYAVVFHGLAYAGATVTTLNPTYGPSELAFQLKNSGASALVTVPMFLKSAQEACAEAGIETLVVMGEAEGATSLSELMGRQLDAQVKVDFGEHVAVLPYSSGTTGFPKGVMLTHRNLVSNLAQCEDVIGVSEKDVAFAVLPFFHIYGMNVIMNLCLSVGATAVTLPRFDMEQMLSLTEKYRMTRLYLVPPIVLGLAKHPMVDKFDLSSVTDVFSGAAPLGADLAEAAAKRVGCRVSQGYGMTELSPVTHSIVEGDYKAGSVGTLTAYTEARLVKPGTQEDVPAGERGELWVRGPQVMKGYLNNPEATANTIDQEGWLHTGDIAVVDEDGHFYIVDRLKELIKVSGFQVPPAELEDLILQMPSVMDVAVIGVADREVGERPKAFVVKKPGTDITDTEIMAFVAEHAATYKQLKEVEFLEAIPKSASGKVLRRELRDRA